jgi:outer membrane protein assembly factor BamE (lipoprotein component of BamABCDE complex)
MKKIVILAMLLLLAGCATAEIGRKFDTSAADRIEIGKTTESEVVSLLGQPLQTKVKSDGRKAYGYRYIQSSAHMTSPVTMKSDAHGDSLVIIFSKEGKVTEIIKGSSPGGINK